MSYPIPRGPCLQKSSLISGCSCQRFMVHPLKATTSFDCDGCGHHASFHRMKSHEEEVEQAAQLRDSATVAASAEDNGAHTNQTRRYITQFDSADIYGPLTDDEDDKTVDDRDEEYLDGRERKRRVVARTGSEASEAGSGRGAAAGRGRGTVAARKGKRKRVADLVTLE
ncbi:hypothetical protein DRE_00201 [Drechslerella stenobrocha 248]|uniref:Uncharacterized protein n=1 Tax=Drechslerella stenobrocha 248 TaxID=1043628 RepID=W7HXG1_9PEZI|nr:hypothetical protein DRE_00201 [Drechslerella stenobrocha 248]